MELIFYCVKERDDLMENIIKQEIEVEEALKKNQSLYVIFVILNVK